MGVRANWSALTEFDDQYPPPLFDSRKINSFVIVAIKCFLLVGMFCETMHVHICKTLRQVCM